MVNYVFFIWHQRMLSWMYWDISWECLITVQDAWQFVQCPWSTMITMMMIDSDYLDYDIIYHLPSWVQYFVATFSSENISCGNAENTTIIWTDIIIKYHHHQKLHKCPCITISRHLSLFIICLDHQISSSQTCYFLASGKQVGNSGSELLIRSPYQLPC